MRPSAIIAVALLATACGGSDSSPSLNGTWQYVNSAGTAGSSATFHSDGTYVGSIVKFTSTTTANAEIETGRFTTTSGHITFTPQQYSCARADPVYTAGYSFSGSDLVLSMPSSVVVFQPDTSPASSVVITMGCFDPSTGTFTPSPLAPVSN